MTEQEWLNCTDPTPMLEFLRSTVGSDRKFRLFAAQSVRLASDWLIHPNSKAAVETAECVADGHSGADVLAEMYRAAWGVLPLEPCSDLHITAARAAARAVEGLAYDAACFTKNEIVEFYAEMQEEKAVSEDEKYFAYWIGKAQGESLLANFLRDIFGNPFRKISMNPAWLTSNVVANAHQIYSQKSFENILLLANALEDAGCNDAELIGHCRQPGPHVRGCWVIDSILAKRRPE